ncbi:MAG: ribosome maturation factor RimP [Gammaproteobacteria bacterium]
MITQLNDIIRPVVTGLGYELWGCEYIPRGQHSLLRIYIESEPGVTVDDCQTVSRQLGAVLEVEDLIQGAYILEVSSPGVSRRLFSRQHYQRYIAHEICVKMHTAVNGRRKFSGLLKQLEGDNLVLLVEGETIELSLLDVDKANLVE